MTPKVIHNSVTGHDYEIADHSSKYDPNRKIPGLWHHPEKTIDVKGPRIDFPEATHIKHRLKARQHNRILSAVVEAGILDPIKAPATLLGMAGSVLVAMPTTFIRLTGFGCWIISNILWVLQGAKVKDFYIMLLFGFYFLTSALGVYNNLPGGF